MKSPTDAELAELLRQPGPADLAALDLRGRNLDNAALRGASLRGTDLTDASLVGADLTDAVLTNAILVGAKLDRAMLAGANLRYANLDGASLTHANLAKATLYDASLQGADLRYADLRESVCRRAFFDDAKFGKALLQGADMADTIVTNPQLRAETRRDRRAVNAQAAKDAQAARARRGQFPRRVELALMAAAGAGVLLAIGVLSALLLGAFPQPENSQPSFLAGVAPPLAAVQPGPFAGNLWTTSISLATVNDDRQTDVLTLASAGSDTYDLTALDGLTGRPLWRMALPGEGAPIAIRPSRELVIAGRGSTVSAYRKGDGALLWTAELPDKLTSVPLVGLHAVGDAVVAHTVDNTLTAFDRAAGTQRWQQTLAERSANDSVALGANVCAKEYDKAAKRHQLLCYAAATGEPAGAIDLGSWESVLAFWPAANGQTLYRFDSGSIVSGGAPSLAAIPAEGDPPGAALWERRLPDAFNGVSFENEVQLVADGERLALSFDDRIALLNGAEVVEATLADHRLRVLAFDGDLLYAAAIKQRGTATLSLLGIDAATGEIRWRDETFGENYDPNPDQSELWAALPGRGIASVGREFAAPGDAVLVTGLISLAGQPAWEQISRPRDGTRLRTLAADDMIFVGTGSALSAFDAATGKLRWQTGR